MNGDLIDFGINKAKVVEKTIKYFTIFAHCLKLWR